MSPRIKFEPIITTTTTTTTTTLVTTVEETTIMSSTDSIDITTELFEHTNEMIISTTESTLDMMKSNENYSSSTFTSTTRIDFQQTTLEEEEQEINSTESMFDYMTTEQEKNFTSITEQELSTNQPRLFRLLVNSSLYMTTEHPITEVFNSTIIQNTTTAANINPCTLENLRANFVYHEYPLDNHKFIFCDSEGKMNIIACSPNYIWSQHEQSCILPN